MPGWQARSPAGGVREATDGYLSQMSMFLSLSPSLPLSLKINYFLKKTQLNKHILEIYYITKNYIRKSTDQSHNEYSLIITLKSP